jgi:putative transposase
MVLNMSASDAANPRRRPASSPQSAARAQLRQMALAEANNGLHKAELIHRRAPCETKKAVEPATLEWVAQFNNHRLLEPIDYNTPPAEAGADYFRQLASQAAAAAVWIKPNSLHEFRWVSIGSAFCSYRIQDRATTWSTRRELKAPGDATKGSVRANAADPGRTGPQPRQPLGLLR